MAATLTQGSTGFDVAQLQLELNIKGKPSPFLNVDAIFGPKTRAAVVAFQTQSKLTPDGIAGPKTQAALAQGLSLTTANHALRHLAQPTPTTCWATSTAMVNNTSVAAVRAKTPAYLITPDGSLLNGSDTDTGIQLGREYGLYHNLRCRPPMSWSVAGLLGLLKRGPIIVDMLWKTSEYVAGNGSPGHMVAVDAVVSDNGSDGVWTHLRILDPWPPGRGRVYWVNYNDWMTDVPTRTYRIFERA